jgi:predicted metal-dependent peptidase
MSIYSELNDLRRASKKSLNELTPAQAKEVLEGSGIDPTTAKYVILKDSNEVINMEHIRLGLRRVDEVIFRVLPDLHYIRKNLRTDFTFSIKTMATSPGRLFINPAFYLELESIDYTRAPLFVVIHEIYHNLYRHFERAKQDPIKYNLANPSIRQRCNMAMDYEINPLVEGICSKIQGMEGMTRKCHGLFDERFIGLFWEDIYDILLEEEAKLQDLFDETMMDNNSQGGGEPGDSGESDGESSDGNNSQSNSNSNQAPNNSQGSEPNSNNTQSSRGGNNSQPNSNSNQTPDNSQGSEPNSNDNQSGSGGDESSDGQSSDSSDGGDSNSQSGDGSNDGNDPQSDNSGSQGESQSDAGDESQGDGDGSNGGSQGSDNGDFDGMSGNEIADKLKNSSNAIDGSNNDTLSGNGHVMSTEEAKRIDKAEGRNTTAIDSKASKADEAMRNALKNKSLMRKLIDDVLPKDLTDKVKPSNRGIMSANNIAGIALAKKEVKVTWEDIIDELFSSIKPGRRLKRGINQHQISTYRAVARMMNSRNMIVPMRSRRDVEMVGAVWILVDTSGSMWHYLSSSVTMIASLAHELIDGLSGLVIIPVDTEISEIQVWDTDALKEIGDIYSSTEQKGQPFKFSGGGGTYFDRAIDFIDKAIYDTSMDSDDISEAYFGGRNFDDVVKLYTEDNLYDGGENIDDAFSLIRDMPPCATLLLTDSDVLAGAISGSAIDEIEYIDEDYFFTFVLGETKCNPVGFGQTIAVPSLDGNIIMVGREGKEITPESV